MVRIIYDTVPSLPDGRLYVCTLNPKSAVGMFHEKHLLEPARFCLEEFTRHLRSVISYEPHRAGDPSDPPDFDAWYERAPERVMYGRPFLCLRRGEALIWRVHEDLITRDLCREINDQLPSFAGAMRMRHLPLLATPRR